MNEKFINFGFAQTAACAMWCYFVNLGYHCNLLCGTDGRNISVDVYSDDKEIVELPGRYCYTSKEEKHFKATKKSTAFTTISYTFEY